MAEKYILCLTNDGVWLAAHRRTRQTEDSQTVTTHGVVAVWPFMEYRAMYGENGSAGIMWGEVSIKQLCFKSRTGVVAFC